MQTTIHNLLSCECDNCKEYWKVFKEKAYSVQPIHRPTGQLFKLVVKS